MRMDQLDDAKKAFEQVVAAGARVAGVVNRIRVLFR